MDDNIQDILNKLKSSFNMNDINTDSINPDTVKTLLSSLNTNSAQNNNNSSTSSKSDIPEIDIEMLLKLKNVMSQLNSSDDDPRANLLLSLKPYLRNEKRDKVDQYIKFLKLGKVFELLKPQDGGDNKNEFK